MSFCRWQIDKSKILSWFYSSRIKIYKTLTSKWLKQDLVIKQQRKLAQQTSLRTRFFALATNELAFIGCLSDLPADKHAVHAGHIFQILPVKA
jgi:hypothetical protein